MSLLDTITPEPQRSPEPEEHPEWCFGWAIVMVAIWLIVGAIVWTVNR